MEWVRVPGIIKLENLSCSFLFRFQNILRFDILFFCLNKLGTFWSYLTHTQL